jgi:hypothetical protein
MSKKTIHNAINTVYADNLNGFIFILVIRIVY